MANQWANRIFRQGDLLIRKVWAVPTNAIPIDGPVLATGEKTGHTHTQNGPHQIFEAPEDISYDEWSGIETNNASKLYLEAKQELSIEHPEHNKITIPKGVYTVVHERQFNPWEGRNEDVFD